MDLLTENSPESCSNIGLECGSCVHACAVSVAAICRDLEPNNVQQIFFQLYPAPGCHAMAPVFGLAYQQLCAAQKPALAFASAAA